MRFILILTISVLIFTNCKDECENDNIILGDVSFDEETSLFLEFYSSIGSISFQNNNGDIKHHTITIKPSTNPRLCVTVLCRPDFEVDGENGCEFYNAEDIHYLLTAEDILLELKAGIDMYLPETELFYDFVEVGLTANVDTIFAGLITSSNFTSPSIDTSQTILAEAMSFMNSDTLGGFQNVWVYQEQNDETDTYLILDKNRGIVEYKYDGQVWTLLD